MADTRTPLMAGNWKMNLNHLEAIALVQKLAFSLDEDDLTRVEVAVLPPFTDLRSVQTLIDGDQVGLAFGAQDVSAHDSGAYTGEISAAMLAKLGCRYAVVGHSERRQYHAESDELVNSKAKAAIRHEITPILCIGEGIDVRKASQHVAHTLDQLVGGLKDVKSEDAIGVVVAYEPVWAIGTGEVATPEDAQEMAAAIRAKLAELYSAEVADQVRVLYGGSVKSGNVSPIMEGTDVDGALVGGASLDADDFAAICKYPG